MQIPALFLRARPSHLLLLSFLSFFIIIIIIPRDLFLEQWFSSRQFSPWYFAARGRAVSHAMTKPSRFRRVVMVVVEGW